MGKFDRFCQSCGMPMEMDAAGGGTNADGTLNVRYCSNCYQNGMFTDGFTEVGQMISFVRKELKNQGYGWFKRWLYTSHLRQLDRWKKA